MFSGSLVAVITPMRHDGSLDADAWDRLIEFHIEQGTSGIVVGGTTGESTALTDEELDRLCRAALRVARGRIPVIAGAGTSSTAVTAQRVGRLSGLGVDGLLVVTPAYVRPTQDGLYGHFAAVAAAARVPVILYNVPSRTAVDLLPATVERLSKLPGIVAIKEAVDSLQRVRELVALSGPGFQVLSGDDPTAREAMAVGARGVISVTANVAPRAMGAMVRAALDGNDARAAELDAPLRGLHQALFVEPNPIPSKWAVAQLGLAGPGIRLPLTPLTEPMEARVREAMVTAGVWDEAR